MTPPHWVPMLPSGEFRLHLRFGLQFGGPVVGKKTRFGGHADKEVTRVLGAPVLNSPEVWRIAQIHALTEVRRLLIQLHDSRSLSPMEFKARLLDVIDNINDQSDEHWSKFIDLHALHELQAESLKELGIPEILTLNDATGLCTIGWLEADGEVESEYWNPVPISLPGDSQERQFAVTPAFRPILRDKLPEGSQVFDISDSRHAALVCITDVLKGMVADIERVVAGAPAEMAWKWLRKMSLLYRDQYEMSRSRLVIDDYKDWVPDIPSSIPLLQAPQIIGQKAGNARSVRTLSLNTTVACLEDAIDRAQSEPYSSTAEERLAQVLFDLRTAESKLAVELGFNNDRLVGDALKDMPGAHVYLMARPIPSGPPAIALIPADRGGVISSFQDPATDAG